MIFNDKISIKIICQVWEISSHQEEVSPILGFYSFQKCCLGSELCLVFSKCNFWRKKFLQYFLSFSWSSDQTSIHYLLKPTLHEYGPKLSKYFWQNCSNIFGKIVLNHVKVWYNIIQLFHNYQFSNLRTITWLCSGGFWPHGVYMYTFYWVL